MILSACGLLCNECEHYNKTCTGCHNVKGSTFWAVEMMPTRVCPLYDCSVNTRNYTDCGDCRELPCDTFRQMKDPDYSDEQHQKALVERVHRLRSPR